MAVIVLLMAASAFFFPEYVGVIRTSWISWLLGVVMFGMGLTLKFDDIKIVFLRPRDIIIGSLSQFIIMPLMAWMLAEAFRLPPELALGVMLVGCCPGGTSSNVITYLAGGDLSLSIGMTSVSTILAPFVTPLLIWLFAGTYVDVDMMSMFMSIIQVIILPICVGLIVKKFVRIPQPFLKYDLPAISTIAITLIVGAVVSANASKLLDCGAVVIIVVVLHNLSGYLLGFLIAKCLRLDIAKSASISVEVGMQNSGLACSLAQQHFQAMALATVPGAIFSVWHNISGAIVARIYKMLINK
ncbi:MAG: bile acid:sodium symporter family protein [Bacteroidaceae bacterium]|nr:bile acid:sodium symporter family protein [Bacteroidaceae bacterium]